MLNRSLPTTNSTAMEQPLITTTETDSSRRATGRARQQTVTVQIAGNWNLADGLQPLGEIRDLIGCTPPPERLAFETRELGRWDSSLLIFVSAIFDDCRRSSVPVVADGLPEGVTKLIDLASAASRKTDTGGKAVRKNLLVRVGEGTLALSRSIRDTQAFVGEVSLSFLRFVQGKARFRASDLVLLLQECGAQALPIVTLISILVGLILAFVGAVQLKQFGAQIYVADLVGIAMAREMGAIMTGIVMAGRTGAAFAARIGTMEVNEEIDAFRTFGISPMDFLVLPRVLALSFMLPLLCIYADFVGIIGGAIIGVGMLDISPLEYFNETTKALDLTQFLLGLIKAVIFGILVAFSGCLRGMRCARSAAAVGEATTSAVVTSIVLIIVFDAIFAVMYDKLGF